MGCDDSGPSHIAALSFRPQWGIAPEIGVDHRRLGRHVSASVAGLGDDLKALRIGGPIR
jgi:hypothetical protein